MMGLAPEDRFTFATSFRDCRTLEFVELMVGLAVEVRATRPVEAAARVRLGLAALDTIEECDRRELAGTRATALRELANAHRLCGDFETATTILDDASRALVGLTEPDQMLAIEGIRLVLLENQEQLDEIQPRFGSALAAVHGASDQSIGFLHLSTAAALQRTPADSFAHCEVAARLLEPAREPRLIGTAFHGLAHSLIRLGYIDDGLVFLRRSLAVFRRWGSAMDRLRVHWIAAKADQRRGLWRVAENKLQDVTSALARLGQPITTGLGLLDLSRTLAWTGSWLQAESAALRASRVFARCGNERYLATAETVLAQAGAARRRSRLLVDELVEDLW